ncbi:MAG: hypothetical protein ACOYW7_05960 [Nitrospirota bacterium]
MLLKLDDFELWKVYKKGDARTPLNEAAPAVLWFEYFTSNGFSAHYGPYYQVLKLQN